MARFRSDWLGYRIVMTQSWQEIVNGRVVTHKGKTIEFRDGVYDTDDAEEIEFLRNHPDYRTSHLFEETAPEEEPKRRGRPPKDHDKEES